MTKNAWIDELIIDFDFRRSQRAPWSPPIEADFQRLEAAVGSALPEEYRYFLQRYGAATLGNDDFEVGCAIAEPCPWGERTRPEYFYPLLQSHPNSVEAQMQAYEGRVPAGVISIVPDAGGNQVCLDVAGEFPGSVWFWDHEQRWFTSNLQDAADELEAAGIPTRRLSVHGIVREWARRHAETFDRPPDYMGMYRMAPSFADFLRSLYRIPY